MEAPLYLIIFLSVILKTSWTENMTAASSEERRAVEEGVGGGVGGVGGVGEGVGDSSINDLTIELSVEELPQASPLIGTFPHDFQLLQSISRRSSYQDRSEGHNYEEQGDDLNELFY